MKRIVVALLVLCFASPLLATGMKLGTDQGPVHLAVNVKGGVCGTNQQEDGSWKANCSDGPSEVNASSVAGCLDSTGSGYCGTDKPPIPAPTVNQLLCPGGKSYYLTSGVYEENDCEIDVEKASKRCQSSDGKNFAEATCKKGCTESKGSGVCCVGGTEGCPFDSAPAMP